MSPRAGGPVADRPRALAVERVGAGERIVLVHGFTQTGRSWREIATRLSDHYEVLCVDLPGHGRSADVVAGDLSDAGRLLAEAAGEATYVGYSMGGRVALHSAFAHPAALRRLVLVGAHPGIEHEDARVARRRADDRLARRLEATGTDHLGIDDFLAEWLAAPHFAHLDEAAAGLDARRENTAAGLARALRALGTGTQEFDRDRLRGLAMPVLVVAGGLDRTFIELGRQLTAVIGENATFTAVPGVGHAVPFEAPHRFAELLGNWLRAP
jgi:2-succinyl-6-hydroxy-2,4-cyclohexadiene-1-carboxylate synthase